MSKVNYGQAICQGFEYLLENHPNVFAIGQGLWSPWYVGNSMKDLEKRFGRERVIDSPISELACTGAAIGASLAGYRPIVVHPRMDFMLLAMDTIINQAAKWSYMYAGQAHPAVTIRGIINRGGEQGAQHSQALHSLFAHIPGLRVVMPSTVKDARDLLIASVLCDDPVLYIDDRWLYDQEAEIGEPEVIKLSTLKPQRLKSGEDITLVGSSYSTLLCREAADQLQSQGVKCDVFDLRVVNPLDILSIKQSVEKTGRLCVVDGGWKNCGLAGEVVAAVSEQLPPGVFKSSPQRVTLPDSPAPTSKPLEAAYYPVINQVIDTILMQVKGECIEAPI